MQLDNFSKNCLEQIIKCANQSITIVDYDSPEQPLIYVNNKFEKITGYNREEILGKNCRFLQGVDTSKKDTAIIKKSVDDFKAVCLDILNYRKNGSTFWNRLSLFPIIDQETQKKYFIGIQYDVTMEVESKHKLEESISKFSLEIGLTKDAISHMAHDLTSGLGNCISVMDLINMDLAEISKETLISYFNIIVKQNSHMINIVNGLLEYSRYKNGLITPKIIPFEFKEIIDNEVSFFSQNIKRKKIELSLSINTSVINSDIDQLSSIVRNILSNAIKYCPESGKIMLNAIQDNEYLTIEVLDSGKGANENTLFMLNNEIPARSALGTQNEQGNGLGICLVQRMTTSLGGNIHFKNSKAAGLCVSIKFPINPKIKTDVSIFSE